MNPLRVAFFTDSFYEVNGAAHTCRQYQLFAERRSLPVLCVHSGPVTCRFQHGAVTTLELKRSWASIGVDVDFGFDPFLWRYWRRIGAALADFQPDIVHIISPGDFSLMGLAWAHKLGIPAVASYHTHLHRFAAARLDKVLRLMPAGPRRAVCRWAQDWCGRGLLKFYQIPRLGLAPNPEIQQWMEHGTGRPCHLMRRGVNTDLFHPCRRNVNDGIFRFGYVGRLTREKNLRLLADVERAIIDAGCTQYKIVIVGHGTERAWLEKHLQRAEFTGVLRGKELARAYANLDLFLFPSRTDTFGNVVQEAMASGTPALVTHEGGPKYIVQSGITGYVAASWIAISSAARWPS